VAKVKIEGTFQVDGLLEGPIFSADDENIIGAFVKQAKGSGLVFDGAVDGGRFSLLPDTEPVEVRGGQESADARIVKCLTELLKNYSPEERMKLMSTLRSVEYISGHEIQTLYGIRPDGTVQVEQRTVWAETVRPAGAPQRRQKLRLACVLAIILGAAIVASAFFVPYRDIAARVLKNARPFKIQDLKIEAAAYEQFFQVESVELSRRDGIISIACRASEKYPATHAELNELWKSARDSLRQRLALEALARNSVRCEFYDRHGNFRGQQVCYMDWSMDDKGAFSIVIAFNRYLDRVKISY
jgi:hypothetical protein